VLLAVGLLFAVLAGAQSLDSAARELSRRVEAAARRQEIGAVTVRNASSLSDADAAQVARVMQAEIHVHPARGGQERLTVEVTLSENAQSYLWVAAAGVDVVMLNVERPVSPAPAQAAVSIRKRQLWEQDRPIQDAAVAGRYLIVLDIETVSFYIDRQLAQALPIALKRALPRDPRGRLLVDGDSFRVLLPELVCNGSVAPSPAMVCSETSAWPLAPGRNYFNEPGLPAYFSSATLPGKRLIAAIDGRTRVYDGSLHETAQWTGWGSDIAAIETGCGAGPAILASKAGDSGDPDEIRIYNLAGRGAEQAGEPALFAGPVTALWPSSGKGEAVAITRNPDTGRYAAYSLAIICDR